VPFKLKKSQQSPQRESSPQKERMGRLSSPELYTFVETSLMSAQAHLTKYRQAPNNLDALAALEWAATDTELANLALVEMQGRLLDK